MESSSNINESISKGDNITELSSNEKKRYVTTVSISKGHNFEYACSSSRDYVDSPSDTHNKIEKVKSTEPPELPKHFSMLSAQRGKEFDEVAHFKLKELLLQNGYCPTETLGNWGNIETCFMVPHSGSEVDRKFLETLALEQFKQEAILHSSDLVNTLVFADGNAWEGNGLKQWKRFRKYFTELRSGQRFRLFVSPFKT